jgi:Flp pilus assembly protein TadD
MTTRFLLYVASLATLAPGCATKQPQKIDQHYATVAQDLGRNTDLARKLNAEAIGCIESGQWDRAEQLLHQALEADVTFGPAHNNLGNVYYHQSKFYLAAWEFQYAVKLMPYSIEPRNNLGMVLEAVGKFDDAVSSYNEALALEPANPQIIGNNVRARVRRGDRDTDVQRLLVKVVMNDSRPEWSSWAREVLALRQHGGATTLPAAPAEFPRDQ